MVDYNILYPLTNNRQKEYTKSVQIYVTNHILDQNPSVCLNAEILVIIKATFTKFGIQVAIYPMPIKLIGIIVCHVHRIHFTIRIVGHVVKVQSSTFQYT